MSQRIATRRRRIAPVVAVILLLLVVAVKLLSVGWFSRSGLDAFAAGDYDASATDFGRVELVNVVESWKAPFDRGVALYRAGDLDGAEAAFRRARGAAPERCDVLTNLVLTIETRGDRRAADGDRDGAGDRYVEARDLADALDCPIPDDADDRDPAVVLDEARRRLDAKLADDPTSTTTEPDDSQSTSTTTTTVAAQPDESPSAPTAEQQARLDELADSSATKNNEQSGDQPQTTRPDSGGW